MSSVKEAYTKKYYLEVLRIIASFLVITNHVNNPAFYFTNVTSSWYISIGLFYFSKIAVPVFLMISGCLLLGKIDTVQKYVNRILRCVCVIFVFSVVYYVYYYNMNEWSIYGFFNHICDGTTIAFWYLYLYLGILIILPILQRMTSFLSKKTIEVLLVIAILVCGSIPMIATFVGIEVNKVFQLFGYIPYIGLLFSGYYIDKYLVITKKTFWISQIVFCVLILVQVLTTEKLFYIDGQNYMLLDNRVFPTITISAICFFVFVKYIVSRFLIEERHAKLLSYVGGLTFGIYLLGDLFINVFSPVIENYYAKINTVALLFIVVIMVYLTSAFCTAILKVVPIIKKLL